MNIERGDLIYIKSGIQQLLSGYYYVTVVLKGVEAVDLDRSPWWNGNGRRLNLKYFEHDSWGIHKVMAVKV
jgi:hypothetical protein